MTRILNLDDESQMLDLTRLMLEAIEAALRKRGKRI
jgi:hypothetical protein